MKTKNGIELDLKQSEYKIEELGFIFYFSSKLYLEKFKNELYNFIDLETSKIRSRYKVNIDLRYYLAISLYKRIEKRGFYIEDFSGTEEKNIEFDALMR